MSKKPTKNTVWRLTLEKRPLKDPSLKLPHTRTVTGKGKMPRSVYNKKLTKPQREIYRLKDFKRVRG